MVTLLITYLTMKEIDFRTVMILECLGEPIRYQIIRQLQKGPKAVHELASLTKRHQATICEHLRVLRDLHLVRYRNRGIFTIYELKLRATISILNLARTAAKQIVKQTKPDLP